MNKKSIAPIICFGEVLWDMLPDGSKPGGAPLNFAIHLKRNGLTPILISSVGNDNDGKSLIHFLKTQNIDTSFVQQNKKLPTSRVLVHLDQNNNATYEICKPVSWDEILFSENIKPILKKTSFLVYGTLASRTKTSFETLLEIINQTEAPKLIDVNLRPPFNEKSRVEKLLFLSDFAKLNYEELEQIANWHTNIKNEKHLIRWFSEYYNCKTVCVTRGDKGAVLFANNLFFEHPGFSVQTVDTVGAGDSFLAALIAALLQNIQPQNALEFACATGAFVASKPGAVPHYTISDIEKIKNLNSK